MAQPLWKTVWRFLRTLKMEQLYDLAIVLLEEYPEESRISKIYLNIYVYDSLFTIAKNRLWANSSSTDQWDKQNVVYLSICLYRYRWRYRYLMEYYSATRNKEILSHAAMWIKLQDIMLSEKASHKKTQIVIPYDSTLWGIYSSNIHRIRR